MPSPRRSRFPTGGCAAPGRSTTRACRDWGSLSMSMEIASSVSGFGPDARHRQEASVGIVAFEQGGDSAVIASISAEFSDILAREQVHRPVLGGDDRRIRPCRGGCRADEGLDLTARRPTRERRRPAGPGVGYRPGPAEGCHEPQLGPVGQVDQRLEGGARFQQDAAQPVCYS